MDLLLPAKFAARSVMRLMVVAVFFLTASPAFSQIRITEYMYSGANGEFVEFTNVGNTPVDMTGWSFDDATRNPGVHSLTGFGTVQPGESVIVTETSPVSVFRAAWGLCAGIKIVGGYTNDNLGRADEINLYDAANNLVDRLTYDDQSLGGPRTQNKSAWVKPAGLGANTPSQWTLSAVGDAEGSFASSGGDIGSPGKSTRATVVFNPCVVVNGAPTIVMDTASTTNFLDGSAVIPPASPFTISGVIGDPTDPASLSGIDFIIGDDQTPVANLVVTASSNNHAVVLDSMIVVTGSGAARKVRITPIGVGYASITITVSDGSTSSTYVLIYGASAGTPTPEATRWHTGISDASDAIALDSNYFVTGDDELDVLNVYSRSHSGLPLVSYNYAASLNLPDPAKPEVDVEAAARSVTIANRVYWLGSMSNGKSPFDAKPNRNRLFATDISGTGAATTFSFVGYYGNLRSSLVTWGDAHGYDLSSSAAAGVDSKTVSGFAAEGLVVGPDSTTLYIGLRAPLVPTANRTKAVIAPLLNFESWFNNGAPAGDPVFGDPIELNLGGRGIRDLIRLSNGVFVILAGSSDESLRGALYKWSGKAGDTAILVDSSRVVGLNMEGAMSVQENGQLSLTQLQVVTDKGGDVLYNDGVEAKSLGDNNLKKFRSDLISGLDWTPAHPNGVTVAISAPSNNASFPAGTPIHVTAQASGTGDSILKVVFFAGSDIVAVDSIAPYELTAVDVEPGLYLVTARAYGSLGHNAVSDTVRIMVTGCTGSGSISGEGFTDIPGSSLINLASSAKYPNHPDVRAQLNKFEYGPNIGDNYGARVRGYVCAPVTGNYIFYLASDEQSELWLSTDENPANIRRIAYLQAAVGFRSWYINPSQHSAAIRLVKGVRYYIETVHKEGTGNDHLSVGWVLPGGHFEAPIPGSSLSPFAISADTVAVAASPEFSTAMRSSMQAAANGQATLNGLKVTASPNPSPDQFHIVLQSKSDAVLSLKVVDLAGRIVEVREGIAANTTLEIGSTWRAGIYFVDVVQGDQKLRLKLVKL